MKGIIMNKQFSSRLIVVGAALLAAGAASAAPTDMADAPLATVNKAGTVQVTETFSLADHDGTLQPATIFNVSLLQPGKLHIDQMKAGEKTPNVIVTSDGTTSFRYDTSKKQYTKMKASLKGLPGLPDYPAGTPGTDTTLDGKPALFYKVIKDVVGQKVTQELWVDPATHLPERQSLLLGSGDAAKEVERILFSDWVLGKTLSPTLFAFTPPVGATEFIPKPAAPRPPAPALLADGTAAPDFTAIDKDGKSVKLSDYKGKVVVIDFWASWCPPCRASMPHNQEVAKKFQDAGTPFVLLAVDNSEDRDAFSKWVATNGPDLSALTFVHVPTDTKVANDLYHVSGIPTQYVIDPKGNIVKSFVGYGGPSDDLANAVKAAGASS
jgi:thiol-disulfide isomerase/thioredoxin/outer membrane lipoprotein-sorting protein